MCKCKHLTKIQQARQAAAAVETMMLTAAVLAAAGVLSGIPPTTIPPPLPPWAATWNMSLSTIAMPCNASGWFDLDLGGSYGLVSYDWVTPAPPSSPPSPLNCLAVPSGLRVLSEQCQAIVGEHKANGRGGPHGGAGRGD